MTNEQIQEAKEICEIYDTTINLDMHPALVPALRSQLGVALDDIERLQKSIEALWLVVVEKSICTSVKCNWDCGSPGCKRAFMRHYLGEK
jgi:hypothetical protein